MNKDYIISVEKFFEAKKILTQNGGVIYPDDTFEIRGIRGFQFVGEILNIRITDKPWLASWGMIDKKMDEFFR